MWLPGWRLAALASCDEGAACRDHTDDGDDQGDDGENSAAAGLALRTGRTDSTGGARERAQQENHLGTRPTDISAYREKKGVGSIVRL